jgi:aminoglycoside phosphotransferase family enzyme
LAGDIADKATTLQQPHYGLDVADVQAVLYGQARWLGRHAELLSARAGLLVDGHGDLRPEHVCLREPTPVVIDCLEFDRELRRLDPVSELSFLALECRRLGAAWIGERLLQRYAEMSHDQASTLLIRFYQSHHALVRATVAVWHLDDDAVVDEAERWRERGRRYLEIARELLRE